MDYIFENYIYKKKTYYAANIYYIEASHHGIGLLLVKLSDLNVNVHKILKKKNCWAGDSYGKSRRKTTVMPCRSTTQICAEFIFC